MSNRFISESDIEAKKQRLKEAWKATKGEEDPEEPPEEPPIDNRTLYHRLEEQKLKKQEEYEDAHRLKNMVRGLEDDEVEFLELVDRTKMEQEKKVKDEENNALSDFRKRRAEMEMARSSELVAAACQSSSSSALPKSKNISQKSLLSGAIKRKQDGAQNSTNPSKKTKTDAENGSSDSPGDASLSSPDKNGMQHDSESSSPPTVGRTGYLHCVGTLPGLGNYTDSSDSVENSSSDSDEDFKDRRGGVCRAKPKSKKGGGGGGGGGGCC